MKTSNTSIGNRQIHSFQIRFIVRRGGHVLRNTRHEAVANVNDSDQGRKLTNVLRKFVLTNVIKEPTRITETTKTLIDLSIISDRTKVVKAGVFETYIADHRLIYTVLKLSNARVPPVIRSVINWKNCIQDTFRHQVAFIPWHACNVFDDIDDNYWMANALYQNIKLSKIRIFTRKKGKGPLQVSTLDEW